MTSKLSGVVQRTNHNHNYNEKKKKKEESKKVNRAKKVLIDLCHHKTVFIYLFHGHSSIISCKGDNLEYEAICFLRPAPIQKCGVMDLQA